MFEKYPKILQNFCRILDILKMHLKHFLSIPSSSEVHLRTLNKKRPCSMLLQTIKFVDIRTIFKQ